VKKVYFPRLILPLSATLANLVTYLLSLLVQFGLVAALFLHAGHFFSPLALALPAVVLFHLLFNFALALLLSAINVYVRDAEHLVGIGLSAWFFVTPVMYNLTLVQQFAEKHPWVADLYLLNPMAVIITAYRAVITPGVALPWAPAVLATMVVTGLLLVLAYRVFDRLQKDFADLL
jgi:ABC-type polysaccharide/polyol phosphate export permease